MSTGLMIVHLHSRFTLSEHDDTETSGVLSPPEHLQLNKTESHNLSDYIMRLLTISAEQIVILILLVALLVKFVFFEGREDLVRLSAGMNEVPAIETSSQTDEVKVGKKSSRVLFTLDDAPFVADKAVQTDQITPLDNDEEEVELEAHDPRSLEECVKILKSDDGPENLTDDEIVQVVKAGGGHCPLYNIESILGNPERGVKIRRNFIAEEAKLKPNTMSNLPYKHYDYTKVMNACCENVLGYVQIPVGFAGPLMLDGVKYYVPMATTEGALVASTNRGCKALSIRGVKSVVEDIGMTRAPCVRFANIQKAAECKRWLETHSNFERIKVAFDSTSRYARLQEVFVGIDGPNLYIRFRALTGDAMGMNMVSKGAENALRKIKEVFPEMDIVSLSGNFCSDKKPAAINWIKGRGKRVVCEAIIPCDKLKSILKTDAKTLVLCNKLKNLSGSAMAGSIGGNNAHAANMVTAVFIATGQDPAQNVTSSNCSTNMEVLPGHNGDDLYITCTMPSLEVGTVGGGTVLPGQGACLDILGVRGANLVQPAENAKKLARIICATVMAGELSLSAALVNNDLVTSHMRHNRSSVAVNPGIAPLPSAAMIAASNAQTASKFLSTPTSS